MYHISSFAIPTCTHSRMSATYFIILATIQHSTPYNVQCTIPQLVRRKYAACTLYSVQLVRHIITQLVRHIIPQLVHCIMYNVYAV